MIVLETVKITVTAIEGVLIVIAAILVKFGPDLKVSRPFPLSHILIYIVYGIVLSLGLIVFIWNMIG